RVLLRSEADARRDQTQPQNFLLLGPLYWTRSSQLSTFGAVRTAASVGVMCRFDVGGRTDICQLSGLLEIRPAVPTEGSATLITWHPLLAPLRIPCPDVPSADRSSLPESSGG